VHRCRSSDGSSTPPSPHASPVRSRCWPATRPRPRPSFAAITARSIEMNDNYHLSTTVVFLAEALFEQGRLEEAE
jgi:hypothetical protein